MKSLGRTTIGLLLLVLVAAGAAGAYAWIIWNQSDELLRQTAEERLNEIAPGWNIGIRSARFDFYGQVHLYDVTVPGDDPHSPLMEAPEVILVLDRDTLS